MRKNVPSPAAARLNWALARCAKLQLRLTPARQCILECLAAREIPVDLDAITRSDELKGRHDATTVYRTLMLLKDLEIARQVSVRHGVRSFVLNAPGSSCAYLICRTCGAISQLSGFRFEDFPQTAALQSYSDIHHELEIHGICPRCQATRKNNPPSAKLPVRLTSA